MDKRLSILVPLFIMWCLFFIKVLVNKFSKHIFYYIILLCQLLPVQSSFLWNICCISMVLDSWMIFWILGKYKIFLICTLHWSASNCISSMSSDTWLSHVASIASWLYSRIFQPHCRPCTYLLKYIFEVDFM